MADTKGKPVKKNNTPEEKQQVLSPLKKLLQKSDVLLMLYPKNNRGFFSKSIISQDQITVYNLLKGRDAKPALFILLDTSGGDIYSAVKIMDCLRTKYPTITIVIPQEAKSSGTMMCFGADGLIMSSIAELGPLDKPLPHPDNENAYISALDIIKSLDGMIDTAIDRQQEHAEKMNDKFGIRINTSLKIASDYISSLISPMLKNEDVKLYNQAKRLLIIADKYGTEFLENHMLSYIKDDKLRKRVVDYIIKQFIWLYPDHEFAIRRDQLRELFIIVNDAEKYDFWSEIWKEFMGNLGKKDKVIKFLDN